MHHFFYKIYQTIQKRKWATVLSAVLVLSVSLFFAFQINFEEDISRVLPKNDQTDITAKVLQQLDFSDKIAVIIQKEQQGSFEDLTQMASTFLDRIDSLDQYIEKVQGRLEMEDFQQTLDFVYENLPLFLKPEDYEVIASKLETDSLKKITENNFKTLVSPTGMVSRDLILKDPLGISFLGLQKLQHLNVEENLEFENGFLTTRDRSKVLLFLKPGLSGSETKENTVFAEKLNEIKTQLNSEFSGKATIDFFGANLIAVANASQIKNDILTTITLSISALMLLLIFYYRNVFIPLIVFVPTVFGALTALALVYFLLGTVSAISISVGAILLGVTLDYSLHILTHFKHNNNVKTLFENITKPVVMSSTTTAAAFLCLLFVESDVLKDLGVFAAISVIASAFYALILIPHLYSPKREEKAIKLHFFDRLAAVDFHKNKVLVIVMAIMVVAGIFVFHKLQFNSDISELNYVSEELKIAEEKLESITHLTSKSIYITAYGNSAEEALQKNEVVFEHLKIAEENNEIIRFSSIGNVLFSEAKQKQLIENWETFWNTERRENLQLGLIEEGENFGFKPETHNRFYEHLEKAFKTTTLSEIETNTTLPIDEFVSENDGFYTISTLVKIEESQREQLMAVFQNTENVLLIDRQEINETFLGQLKDDFGDLINYSLIVILLLLWLFFRRIELVLISAIPIVLTAIVTVGVLVLLQIELNIFSLIVCTLVFGIGVDFSIFMTSALQKRHTGYNVSISTYRASILLAVLTTTLAIGVLVFAKHPALKSISVASIVGVFSALVVTFVFYPLLFQVFFDNRVNKGKSPISLRVFINSSFSFFYYGLGGLLITLFGPIYMLLFPAKKETKVFWFRKILSKYLMSVLYTNPFVRKKIINSHNENFEKPAIIISNHSSFLDSIAIGQLHPKIIFLVNDWVYNSSIIGGAARLAGFYPVSKGLESGVSHLREKVKEGYSLMIFPEATRSPDNVLRRFHKGAFFLAEEFNLDILPVYIHGNSEVCPKDDHIIYDGSITVIVGERISQSDLRFGNSFNLRTKSISKYFKKNFSEIRAEIEDENYFINKIQLSYLYKDKRVVDDVRESLRTHKTLYHNLNRHLAPNERILHINNDLGQWDALLTLQEPKRKVDSVIVDSEKRRIAGAGYLVKKRDINYIEDPEHSENGWQTLIISGVEVDETLLNKLLFQAKSVILIHNFTFKNKLAKSFQLEHEKEFLVFKKSESE